MVRSALCQYLGRTNPGSIKGDFALLSMLSHAGKTQYDDLNADILNQQQVDKSATAGGRLNYSPSL